MSKPTILNDSLLTFGPDGEIKSMKAIVTISPGKNIASIELMTTDDIKTPNINILPVAVTKLSPAKEKELDPILTQLTQAITDILKSDSNLIENIGKIIPLLGANIAYLVSLLGLNKEQILEIVHGIADTIIDNSNFQIKIWKISIPQIVIKTIAKQLVEAILFQLILNLLTKKDHLTKKDC